MDRLEKLCLEKDMRMTDQRRVIARVLSMAHDHPDVEELHRRAHAIDPHIFGFPNAAVSMWGSTDHTNTYRVEPRPLQNGITTWQAVWIVVATGLEVAAAGNLSTFTVRLSAIGV